ncbi:hypothetical protein ACFPN4_14640 [Ureibacillus thermophilus]|uniref:hypothetical protein n=1 Tax=Ureibacillus thermophilus TaxID=367743 RepID=UPI0036210DB7
MRAFSSILCLLVLLFGCQSKEQGNMPDKGKEETITEEAGKQNEVDLKNFFKPDNTVANISFQPIRKELLVPFPH